MGAFKAYRIRDIADDDGDGEYHIPASPVDQQQFLRDYAGLGAARCISAHGHVSKWALVRELLHSGALFQNSGDSGGGSRRNRRLGRGVSFGTIAEQTGKIMKHTAIVFDCTNEGTTVFKLRYDMAQGRVVQGLVAECAGVTELLERQAGEWFATFAREIKHHLIEEDGEVDVRRPATFPSVARCRPAVAPSPPHLIAPGRTHPGLLYKNRPVRPGAPLPTSPLLHGRCLVPYPSSNRVGTVRGPSSRS